MPIWSRTCHLFSGQPFGRGPELFCPNSQQIQLGHVNKSWNQFRRNPWLMIKKNPNPWEIFPADVTLDTWHLEVGLRGNLLSATELWEACSCAGSLAIDVFVFKPGILFLQQGTSPIAVGSDDSDFFFAFEGETSHLEPPEASKVRNNLPRIAASTFPQRSSGLLGVAGFFCDSDRVHEEVENFRVVNSNPIKIPQL